MKTQTKLPEDILWACLSSMPLEERLFAENYRFFSLSLGPTLCSMALLSGENPRLWIKLTGRFNKESLLDMERPEFKVEDDVYRLSIRFLAKEYRVIGKIEIIQGEGIWNSSPWLDLLYGQLPMRCFCGMGISSPEAACRWNPLVPGESIAPHLNCWSTELSPSQCSQETPKPKEVERI